MINSQFSILNSQLLITPLNEQNFLILIFYMIVVIYVFYRAIKSLDDKVTIKLNEQFLKEQLEAHNIKDLVEIKINLDKQYKLDKLKELSISLKNKGKNTIIYIDWDRSGLSDFYGNMRRLIRVIPGMMFDVFYPQVNTAIIAGRSMKQMFTAEDVFQRQSDTSPLKIVAPLFDLNKLKNGSKSDKKTYNDFMNQTINLNFSLGLVVRIFDLKDKTEGSYMIIFDFTIKRMFWKEAITWKKKI
ncbi:MAG TPA: hypothetical protein V6C58_14390 [Allocoleopsis sp.]